MTFVCYEYGILSYEYTYLSYEYLPHVSKFKLELVFQHHTGILPWCCVHYKLIDMMVCEVSYPEVSVCTPTAVCRRQILWGASPVWSSHYHSHPPRQSRSAKILKTFEKCRIGGWELFNIWKSKNNLWVQQSLALVSPVCLGTLLVL